MSAPIKRHPALQPMSREHHHGLLLCWKIREGFRKKIEPERIKRYCDWFWENQLQHHFEEEERYLFPILGQKHELVKRAVTEHQKLETLFKDWNNPEQSLHQISEELDRHIRFEERILFNEIQDQATSEQLEEIDRRHSHGKFKEDWNDEFWN
jgi:iron-sulfur cluster repair protein YtfE (RIC family)